MEKLIFKQPKWWKSEWELYQKDRLIGSLKITSKWSWALAEAMIGEKRYQFGYHGWTDRFFIQDAGALIAEAKPRSFWSSTSDIEIKGRRYALSSGWSGSHKAVDGSGSEAVKLKMRLWKCSAEAEVQAEDEINFLLALFLFYRMKVSELTAATTGVIVASLITTW